MTDWQLAAIRERWARATPGPWRIDGATTYGVCVLGPGGAVARMLDWSGPCEEVNGQAIAHAPTDVARLLAEVERLRGAVRTLRTELAAVRAAKQLSEDALIRTIERRQRR